MPLSEIDFSQCLKCSPSYRALPKDYPKPKCSERSPEEESVLNDSVSDPSSSTPASSSYFIFSFLTWSSSPFFILIVHFIPIVVLPLHH